MVEEYCAQLGASHSGYATDERLRWPIIFEALSCGKSFQHRMEPAAGTRFRTIVGGSGELVVLMSDYPQCWYASRRVMPLLQIILSDTSAPAYGEGRPSVTAEIAKGVQAGRNLHASAENEIKKSLRLEIGSASSTNGSSAVLVAS
jgi:hypothetical protein